MMSGAGAQVTVPAQPQMNREEMNRREEMLKPGLEDLKTGDLGAATESFKAALVAFPEDNRVLSLLAIAAERAGRDEEAYELYARSMKAHAIAPWPMRLSILQLKAKLGKWGEFDHDLDELRTAKKSGTDHTLDKSNGFIVDNFEAGGKKVQAVIFPLGAGGYHTLYRFYLPKKTAATGVVASTTTPQTSRCENPNFQPYIDVESDDIDQISFAKAHADKAAKGDRSYSLDTYGAPCSQGLIKFYQDGEPTYEQVRADVIAAVGRAK